jgi:hypothetical protein
VSAAAKAAEDIMTRWLDDAVHDRIEEMIALAIHEAVHAEREACAKVCEDIGDYVPFTTPHTCAGAIRARSEDEATA